VSLVVLLILAVVWAVFLVPQVLRARAEKTSADSIGAFRNQLSVLERTAPDVFGRTRAFTRPAMGRPAAPAREQVRRRRQGILVGLLGAMGATLLLGLLVSKLLLVHAVLDVLFVAYCAMLVRAKNLAAEREVKVRYLPGRTLSAEPTFLLRQSGS
jgi:hypothetical protein